MPPTTATKIPSTPKLPKTWGKTHDRFITYLSTHAPLENGKIPKDEEQKPRYNNAQIASMMMDRFPELCTFTGDDPWSQSILANAPQRIKGPDIQRRLDILELNENDYFHMPYGAYSHEPWGTGIWILPTTLTASVCLKLCVPTGNEETES